MLTRIIKRLIDIIGAGIGMAALSPVMIVVALAVRLRLGSPVLFRQERTGLHEQSFVMYKFRTMTDARDSSGELLPDAQRLTPLGRFLRSSSLDELPELWNVLRGDMSLLGPRPLHPRYLPFYEPDERQRHDVKPGVTGWAQVNGRNETTWDDRLAMDVWYVENRSFRIDVWILLRTITAVARRQGVTATDSATMRALDEVRQHRTMPNER